MVFVVPRIETLGAVETIEGSNKHLDSKKTAKTLEEVIQTHDLILVDSCAITGVDEFADNVYTLKTFNSLVDFTPEIMREWNLMERLRNSLLIQKNVMTVSGVVDENYAFVKHIQRFYYNFQGLWRYQKRAKYFVRRNGGDLRRRRRYNEKLEKIQSMDEKIGEVPEIIKAISLSASLLTSVEKFHHALKVYTAESSGQETQLCTVSHPYASTTDRQIVGTAIYYYLAHKDLIHKGTKCVAILTKDSDIVGLLKQYLISQSRNNTNNKNNKCQMNMNDILDNISIYWTTNTETDTQVSKIDLKYLNNKCVLINKC